VNGPAVTRHRPVWRGARRIPTRRRKWPLIIENELHARLRETSHALGRSMSWIVCDAITMYLNAIESGGPPPGLPGKRKASVD